MAGGGGKLFERCAEDPYVENWRLYWMEMEGPADDSIQFLDQAASRV